jgi:hypothetical protein
MIVPEGLTQEVMEKFIRAVDQVRKADPVAEKDLDLAFKKALIHNKGFEDIHDRKNQVMEALEDHYARMSQQTTEAVGGKPEVALEARRARTDADITKAAHKTPEYKESLKKLGLKPKANIVRQKEAKRTVQAKQARVVAAKAKQVTTATPTPAPVPVPEVAPAAASAAEAAASTVATSMPTPTPTPRVPTGPSAETSETTMEWLKRIAKGPGVGKALGAIGGAGIGLMAGDLFNTYSQGRSQINLAEKAVESMGRVNAPKTAIMQSMLEQSQQERQMLEQALVQTLVEQAKLQPGIGQVLI